mmetsp:Transcript_43756/g.139473  ORF Transcript_43756/g.139473 Transcript_43756/m.139473 type:complete len:205 (+) Transcript_43756:546-1160(+)
MLQLEALIKVELQPGVGKDSQQRRPDAAIQPVHPPLRSGDRSQRVHDPPILPRRGHHRRPRPPLPRRPIHLLEPDLLCSSGWDLRPLPRQPRPHEVQRIGEHHRRRPGRGAREQVHHGGWVDPLSILDGPLVLLVCHEMERSVRHDPDHHCAIALVQPLDPLGIVYLRYCPQHSPLVVPRLEEDLTPLEWCHRGLRRAPRHAPR